MSDLLPFTDGLTHYFDYNDYVSESTAWSNKSSGGNLVVTGGTIDTENKCVKLPQTTGYAYCPYNIGNSCTVYAVVKGDKPTWSSGTTWGIAVCGASDSYRVFCGQTTSTNLWEFYTPGVKSTGISASEWHVMAFSVANGVQKIYFDGELVATTTTTKDFALKGLYINNGAFNGNSLSGTSPYSATMYLRGIVLCTTNHTADQIKSNSNQLAVDFGLKEAEKDLRLTGTDAVAIAYAIAKNIEAMQALEDMKKAYREGIVDGDNGNDEVTEPYTTTDPDDQVGFPDDGESTTSTDEAIIDFTDGYWYALGDRDSGEVKYYVKLWIEGYLDEWYDSAGYHIINRNKIYATVCDIDGTEISTKDCDYQYSYVGYVDRTDTASRAYITGNSLAIVRNVKDSSGASEQTTFYALSSGNLGGIIYASNISPF